MRRLTLLLAGGAVWLFLAAIPAMADNGPHMVSVNNGTAGLTADSCASCHRAHTAQGFDLTRAEGAQLCLLCHGATGTGASTDVESGIQYTLASRNGSTGVLVGALRGGGFVQARIGSGSPTRYSFDVPVRGRGFTGLVPVATTGTATTSRHMNIDGTAFGPGIAWGNGPINATADPGPAAAITCTSCHNPHGNGNYRILVPIPLANNPPAGFTVAGTAANVTDAAAVPAGQVRNYTNPPAQYVSQLAADTNPRDYWRYCAPTWNNCVNANRGDKPNGLSSGPFRTQITAWCSTCHTRYTAPGGSANFESGPSGDAIFAFRHTSPGPECTQCHVAHGSNAVMSGQYSASFPYPDASLSGSSRLLKVDNRGTCQMCHDPTGTVTTIGITTP